LQKTKPKCRRRRTRRTRRECQKNTHTHTHTHRGSDEFVCAASSSFVSRQWSLWSLSVKFNCWHYKKILVAKKIHQKNIGIAKQTSQHLFLRATPVEFCGDSIQCVLKGLGEKIRFKGKCSFLLINSNMLLCSFVLLWPISYSVCIMLYHKSISTGAQYVTLDNKIKCLSLAIFFGNAPIKL
jgi:hypothetical protein